MEEAGYMKRKLLLDELSGASRGVSQGSFDQVGRHQQGHLADKDSCHMRAGERSNGKAHKMLLDIKTHFNFESTEDVLVELLEEVCAAQDVKLQEVGFRRRLATHVSVYHEGKDVNLVVHGNDFTFTGEDASLRWVGELMSQRYEVKVRARLGLGNQDHNEATLMGWIARWEAWGISAR